MSKEKFFISKGALYGLIVAYISILGVVLISVWYSNYVDSRSNQRWCSIIATLDDTYKEEPPTTILGRKLAKDFHQLRDEFEC